MSLFKPPSSKGKQNAIPQDGDFQDIDPMITYRHVISPPPGARNPLRVVSLCDSDAFYATCEQVRLGIDPSKPLVVRQWDSLIAVNYPARKFGISRMDRWKDALKKCPELVIVHVATYKEGDQEPVYRDNPDTTNHKISLDFYRRESGKVLGVFKEGLTTGVVEKASIDEVFLDLSVPVRDLMLERYPHLSQVPSDAPDGLDTPLPPAPRIDWDGRGILIPVYPESKDDTAAESEEAVVPRAEPVTTWHDVALSIGAELMNKLRNTVKTTLGYTMSAGIARNKFLAKLIASYKKFDSQSILRNSAIPNYLRPLPFQKIRMLGGKLGQSLSDTFGAATVSDILYDMQRNFGDESTWIYELFRGIDRSEVKDKTSLLTKSMMASKNLPHPITKASDGPKWMRALAAELALRLKDIREDSPAVWPKTLVLHVRRVAYGEGRSKQMSFPFTNDLNVESVAVPASKLWKELVGVDDSKDVKITHLALGFSGVEAGETGQQNISGFFNSTGPSSDKPTSRGSAPSSKRKRESLGEASGSARPAKETFLCARCQRQVEVPEVDSTLDDDERAAILAKVQQEHEDFHVAQDLAKADSSGTPGFRPSTATVTERPFKRKKPALGKGGKNSGTEKGIAKFFVSK
ncbi:DNA/RNA polymerase [Peniophora sp. CONT]|nr:DNA/RNA polymerase [Peniophora sp. CONT]